MKNVKQAKFVGINNLTLKAAQILFLFWRTIMRAIQNTHYSWAEVGQAPWGRFYLNENGNIDFPSIGPKGPGAICNEWRWAVFENSLLIIGEKGITAVLNIAFPDSTAFYGYNFEGKKVVLERTSKYVTAGHLGGNIKGGDSWTYYPKLWDEIISKYEIKSVLDIGCGEGHMLEYCKNKLVDMALVGIDGLKQNVEIVRNKGLTCYEVDFENNQSFSLTMNFDLCWCCEFVEHINEMHIHKAISIMKAAKYVAMTHATPGQPGHHHVNCQPSEYWIAKMSEHGFKILTEETNRLTKLAHGHFQIHGLFFKNEAF